GPLTKDGLDLTPCAREILLNAALPLCVVIISTIFLVIRTCCRRSIDQSVYFPLVFNEQITRSQSAPNGSIPMLMHDVVQLILSFIQLGSVGFILGWRINEIFEVSDDSENALYWFIGIVGLFISWLYITALIACHSMTRRTQYAFIKHLLVLYTLLFIIACFNLRSIIINETTGIVFIFAIWNVGACGVLFVSSLLRPRNPELMYTRNKMISRDTIASLWSLISFSWMAPIIRLGNGHDLTVDDLWELPFRCQAAHCYLELDR
ncbi:18735_t:CDS:2, partial [Racocetra persica]